MFAPILILMFGQYGVTHVMASPNGIVCDWDGLTDGKVDYGEYESKRGNSIIVDSKEPENVVVVGQDEKRVGVSFRIEIASQPGTITYQKVHKCAEGKDLRDIRK